MVGQVVAMVVVPPIANAFCALDLLEGAVRVLTLDYKAPEVTQDKVQKRYAEVGAVVWGMGGGVQAAGCVVGWLCIGTRTCAYVSLGCC